MYLRFVVTKQVSKFLSVLLALALFGLILAVSIILCK